MQVWEIGKEFASFFRAIVKGGLNYSNPRKLGLGHAVTNISKLLLVSSSNSITTLHNIFIVMSFYCTICAFDFFIPSFCSVPERSSFCYSIFLSISPICSSDFHRWSSTDNSHRFLSSFLMPGFSFEQHL